MMMLLRAWQLQWSLRDRHMHMRAHTQNTQTLAPHRTSTNHLTNNGISSSINHLSIIIITDSHQ